MVIGTPPDEKINFEIFLKNQGNFMSQYLMFSYCMAPILWELIERTCFEIFVSLVDGSKHGIP